MTQGDIHYVIEHLMTSDGTYSAFGDTYAARGLAGSGGGGAEGTVPYR